MSDEKNVPSWWTTLPGVITAVTGLLTAVGGLLVVLNTVGVFHNSSGHSAQEGTSASQAAPSLPGDPRAAEKTEPESESKWDALVDVANLPSGYNHAVRIGNLILDYQSSSGAAEVRRIDGSGNTSIVKSYPSGFSPGWADIVSTPNGILFYKRSGEGALGRLDESGSFTTLISYAAGSFPKGSTNIVNTPNGILFYNTQDGAATVERIDENGNHTTSNLIPLVELIHL